MKFALCLRGLNEQFRNSCQNLQAMIIDDLRKNGHTVDIFLNTYKNHLHSDLVDFFKPVDILYNEPRTGSAMWTIVSKQVAECCKIVQEYEIKNNVKYDYIIITRFDLTFNNKYSLYDINYNNINMECMFVPDFNSGDNFFLFPENFSDKVILSVNDCENEKNNSHQLWRYFEKQSLNCHYIGGKTSKRGENYDIMFRFTRHIKNLHEISNNSIHIPHKEIINIREKKKPINKNTIHITHRF